MTYTSELCFSFFIGIALIKIINNSLQVQTSNKVHFKFQIILFGSFPINIAFQMFSVKNRLNV